jgi:hypothetical protein
MNKLKAYVTNFYVKQCSKKFPLIDINMEGDHVNKFRVCIVYI